MNHNQKTLLILGGTRISLQILFAAKELGLLVYVTDYNEDSPCKAYADKNFMISATDTDAVAKLIKNERIDGVLMGYADVLLPAYIEICKKANLPCYANSKAIEITANKKKFKDYCRKFDIPVVNEYSYKDVKLGRVAFPLIIKPVDNSGARGIFICHSQDEFNKYYIESLKFSPSGHLIIERLIDAPEATIFYYLHNGEIYLLGVGDRWMYKQQEGMLKLPVGYTFPSYSLNSFIEKEDAKIKSMFKSLNMTEGMVFMQTFVENGKYTIYEMGYRLTGSIEHHLYDRRYGFNHLKAIIKYAVGEDIETEKVKNIVPQECHMANVTLLLRKGQIDRFDGIEKLVTIPNVVAHHVSYLPGDIIDDNIIGKLAQVGVRILITASCEDELHETMDKVKNTVHAISTDGKEMIISDYSYSELCKRKY